MTTTDYSIIAEANRSTVVAEYERAATREESYQSEADLEATLIAQLQQQGYDYLPITSEEALIANLRQQLARLNGYAFSDDEWQRFFAGAIKVRNRDIVAATRTIQKDYIKTLLCDDGQQRNIYLLDKKNIHANKTQVINQYVPAGGDYGNRYDVTILVNGLPLVHIELKRRGRSIKEAFNQINRYARESFWAGSGLYEYVQLFVISNGTETKYYSNTTRWGHISEQQQRSRRDSRHRGEGEVLRVKTSNSYEFTNYWADATNTPITDLVDFTATFFSRHTLLSVLTRYCVFTEQERLLAMRPYQIVATERVLNQIDKAHHARTYGRREAGGYIWHTTGSGKTLTSFKTALLATQMEYIDKVLFVVDRKDLDYQTMREYDSFERGAANGNTSTQILARQLADSRCRIIITTIQKLNNYVSETVARDIYNKEVVIIFDECHRSQFGAMHKAITRKFKRYYLFGFTGTPIFNENRHPTGLRRTTDDLFGTRLHCYTIVDAIRDHNVLPFRITYIRTMHENEEIENKPVWDIDREGALQAPERIKKVTAYILQNFAQQTKRASFYTFSRVANIAAVATTRRQQIEEQHSNVRLNGFNSIFAVQSIESAKRYYNEFQQQNAALPPEKRLTIATIFSFAANEEGHTTADGSEQEENPDSTAGLDPSSRAFLDAAIADYNALFATNYDTSAEKFPNYYKDVSLRMKNREIDLLIVVNMFLTGFDATTLNTLWVDKNLRYHGLLQAFSRTNRILNAVKVVGNIVCFRNLEEATNEALALYGDSSAHGTTILRPFNDYFYGYNDENGKHVKGYMEYVAELMAKYKPGEPITDTASKKDFIRLFGSILRMINLLSNFEQFPDYNPLTERDLQDYTSQYIDLADEYRRERHKPEDIHEDIEFEMELIKQVEVNVDFILYLVALYHESHCRDEELLIRIQKSIDASANLRDKKDLIMQFIDTLTPQSNVDKDWKEYINTKKREEYAAIIAEEQLKKELAITFIERAFEQGYVPEVGMEIDAIMPATNIFDPDANHEGTFQRVLNRIKAFFNRFYEIANGEFRTVNEAAETE